LIVNIDRPVKHLRATYNPKSIITNSDKSAFLRSFALDNLRQVI
jgi:hypothetical protein